MSRLFNHFPINRQRLVILLILWLAFGLRSYQLDSQSLRGDEAATVLYSALPITDLWELSRITDPHPPFYYLLLHPWQWLVGEGAWVMRFAGVMASVLAVAALYGLVQLTLNSTPVALMAAALLAINPFQIWLAQDIRAYPFFTLLGLLSSGALWLALHHRGGGQFVQHRSADGSAFRQSALWLSYSLLTVACLYIHYYTVFLIAFQALFVLINLRKFWDKKWPWFISQLIVGLLIIPGLGLAYNFIGQAAGGIDKISTPTILQRASTALLSGITLNDGWGLWLSLLLAPIWIAGLVSLWRREVTIASFWSLFFVLPVLGVITLSIDRPFFKERFLIQAQPAFELLLAVGFLRLIKPGWRAVSGLTRPMQHGIGPQSLRIAAVLLFLLLLAANALALSNYFANPAYAKSPPWQLYNDYVSQEARSGDVMLTNFPEAAVSYYSPDPLPFYVTPAERDRPVVFRVGETAQIANAYKRIWFLPLLRQGFDEQGEVLNWLDRHADRVNQVFFPVYNINLYLSPPTIETMMINQPVPFAHGLHLRGYQIFDRAGVSRIDETEAGFVLTVRSGEEFTLSLYWQAEGPTTVPYTVFTHLIAVDGFNRTGQDNQPVWNTYPTTRWQPNEKITDKYTLTVPPDTPPGDHRLRIGWYRADTLERVPVLDEAGHPVADHALLSVIVKVE